jgi:hypothetical protein
MAGIMSGDAAARTIADMIVQGRKAAEDAV